MDSTPALADDIKKAFDDLNNSNVSYSTDAQSVQSGTTHGTHPHSPARTTTTPVSLSPASCNLNKGGSHQIPDSKISAMEAIPQYNITQQQQQQGDWQMLEQHRMLETSYQQNRQRSNPASDDDQTEPSSSANTRENNATTFKNENNASSSDTNTGATSTFGRLVESAVKTINNRPNNSTNTGRKDSADEEGVIEGVLIYGYLQKLNRNGKWQTRWFESDGECLTYFKSSKRVKLLASLDLAKVGSIAVNNEDESGCCFTINIAKRPYHLRADSKTAMKDWVITLNRVKEARLQEGNVKLFMPNDLQQGHNRQVQPPIDLLDDLNYNTPRVVVVANRQRTHAVENDDFHSWEDNCTMDEKPQRPATIARWQKPTTSIAHLASKVLRWARSIRKYHCSADAPNHVMGLNHNHSTAAATQSVSTTQTPNIVPTADLLETGCGDTSGKGPTATKDNDDDDENAARFLS